MTGNVNTAYALWTQTAPGPFIRVGEISGLGVDPRGDGLFSISARSSAASWVINFYTLNNDALQEIAFAEITLSDTDESQTCTVSDSGGLAAYGLSLEEAQSVFCSMD